MMHLEEIVNSSTAILVYLLKEYLLNKVIIRTTLETNYTSPFTRREYKQGHMSLNIQR